MTAMQAAEMLGLLIFAHALADYPLQGSFMSAGKNRQNPLPGVPWSQILGAHAVIHGGMVGLVTGSLWLGLAETVLHALIDDAKCAGRIGFHMDQALHLGCKLLWIALVWMSGSWAMS